MYFQLGDIFFTSARPVWGRRRSDPSSSQLRNNNFSSPFVRNSPGSVAHEVLESKGIRTLKAEVRIEYCCRLPPPDSSKEPKWLKELRRQWPEWTEELDDDIVQIKTFEFQLTCLTLNLAYDGCEGWWDLDDTKSFLLLLEGLDWK